MRSRPGIFASLVLAVAISSSAIGFLIFDQSQKNQAKVTEQSRQYEASKSGSSGVAEIAENGSLPEQEVPQVEEETGAVQQQFTVYFSKNPESGDDTTKVFPVIRYTGSGDTLKSALKQIIAGPNQQEKADGYFGGMSLEGKSNCEGEDFTTQTDEKTLKLQFCKVVALDSGVEASSSQSQVIATIKDLARVESVIILGPDGQCLFGGNLENNCQSQ